MRSTMSLIPRTQVWWVLLVMLTSLAIRLVGLDKRWLWLDEILTANWSVHGLWSAFAAALRFDTHPPLYYLQLSLWALFGNSDLWLMTNTILWSVASVGLLVYTVSRVFNFRTGLLAGFLLCFSPVSLAYADTVRMYTFQLFLMILYWYIQERWVTAKSGRFGLVGLVLVQSAIVDSQAAGLVLITGGVCYGFWRVLAGRDTKRLIRWILIEATVAVLALPALTIATLRVVTHPKQPDLSSLADLAYFFGAGGVKADAVVVGLTLLVAVCVVFAAIYDRCARSIVLTWFLVPIIASVVISYAFRPMWLSYFFVPLAPFVCITIAVAGWSTSQPANSQATDSRSALRYASIALLAAWSAIGLYHQIVRTKGDGFKLAAEAVGQITSAGDIVLVRNTYDYWCFNWYFAGPNWGDPRHAFLMTPEWASLMSKLPTGTAAFLGLNQSANLIDVHGVKVALWDGSVMGLPNAPDIIVIGGGSIPGRHITYSSKFGPRIDVARWN